MTVEQYNRDLAAWEQQASGKNKSELQQKPPKKSAFERNSGIWMQKPGSGTTQSVRNTGNAAVMTEGAKTEENTVENLCGAYIEMPCKFAAYRDK